MVGVTWMSGWLLFWPERLAWPWMLALCLLPPLFFLLGKPAVASVSAQAIRLPWMVGEPQGEPGLSTWWRLSAWLFWLGWCCLCVALARPQQLGEAVPPMTDVRQMMLALDISGSMNEADMRLAGRPATRLMVARHVLDDFLEQRAGDHIGLIVFASQAYVLAPLTPDLASVRSQLASAEVGLAGRETALGEAVGLAVKRLRQQPEGERVIVLLTDGVNNAGSIEPEKAAELAAADKVRIYTIAFGGDGSFDFFGMRIPGQAADMDEVTLKKMADITGGRFFRAGDSEELEQIYDEIDRLEPISVEAAPLRPWMDRYVPWLLVALVLLVVALALERRR